MKYSNDREVNTVINHLIDLGFVVTGYKTHIKLLYRSRGTLTVSKSPSCHHWKNNVLKDAQRIMRQYNG